MSDTRSVKLIRGPEGSPNFCFGLYAEETGECLEFVQSDYELASLAARFGWRPCKKCDKSDGTVKCKHRSVAAMLADAFDFLSAHDGEVFEIYD